MGYTDKDQIRKLSNMHSLIFELRERMALGQVYLPPGFPVETVREEIRLEYERAMITLSLSVACGQRTRTDTVYFDMPATWWDHLKMQAKDWVYRQHGYGKVPWKFCEWLERHLSVRFVAKAKEVVVAENFCPHLQSDRPRKHIQFLTADPEMHKENNSTCRTGDEPIE